MKKVLLFLVLAMAAVSIPLTAMGDLMRSPPPTEYDELGNISLSKSYLMFQNDEDDILSVYTFSRNDMAWGQFELKDINWGKYTRLENGTFKVANLTTYNWDDSEYGKTPTSFILDFQNNIGNMFTNLGDYSFDIYGNKECLLGANFEPVVAPVPEPTTMSLFGIGLAGLIGIRLKTKKKKSELSTSGGLVRLVKNIF